MRGWRGTAGRVRARIEQLFPERQLFYRVHDKVVFVRFGRARQMALLLVAGLFAVWVVYASLGLALKDGEIASRDAEIEEMMAAYRSLGEEMSATETRFMEAARALQGQHERLSALVEQRDALLRELSGIRQDLAQALADREEMSARRKMLDKRLSRLESQVVAALGDGSERIARGDDPAAGVDVERHLDSVENDVDRLISAHDETATEARRSAAQAEALAGRVADLVAAESRLEEMIAERDRALAMRQEMETKVAGLEERLNELRDAQHSLIARVQSQTQSNLGELEALIASTGLNVDRLLSSLSPEGSGIGGPFVSLETAGHLASEYASVDDEFEASVARLEHHLDRWTNVQNLLPHIPLASPMDIYAISSGFGKRHDPISKALAFHSGVDLTGPLKAPVLSTAPGTVSFVGRRGPYGKVVEIDHGYGLRTMYAHLSKVSVKTGQKVRFRERIGTIGNTGRSTGIHVHYEVIFHGRSYDPTKFIEAGRSIFKG